MSVIIPLVGGESNAQFSQSATLNGYSIVFEFHYQQSGQWLLHVIADGDVGDIPTYNFDSRPDDDFIAAGLMLEPGCDIIESYQITELFGQLFIVGDATTLDNLGADNSLVYYPPEEALSYDS